LFKDFFNGEISSFSLVAHNKVSTFNISTY
jgi:hypothetical protein